jgi:hypothetical protein
METGVFEKGQFLQPPLYFLLAAEAPDAPSSTPSSSTTSSRRCSRREAGRWS